MKAWINGHCFNKLTDNFKFSHDVVINQGTTYTIDDVVVPQEEYFRVLRREVEKYNLEKRLVDAEKEIALLRDALLEVEYDSEAYCLWCWSVRGNPHDPNCKRQIALGDNPTLAASQPG